MTRSNAREIAMQIVFSLKVGRFDPSEVLNSWLTEERFQELAEEMPLYDQFPEEKQEQYIRQVVLGTVSHGEELDRRISQYAVGWAFSRIPKMAVAIMKVAMFEVLYLSDVPTASAIDEAVEIAKGYEPPEVVSFLNGILGSFVRAEFPDAPPKPQRDMEAQPE
ncbi:MAG: transcription antitermination factor NusB [Lawsonibacter sp.]|nr:transcription antitermination factor NusB [Lawsonibacter sp.]